VARALVTVCAVLAATWFPPAHSGYVVELGNGESVCDTYKNNLAAVAPIGPSAQRGVSSAFPEIQTIEWSRLPEVAVPTDAIVKLFWERDANPVWYLMFPDQWSNWRGTAKDVLQARRNYTEQIGDRVRGYAQSVSFQIAHVDIDNDGVQDTVVQFSPDPFAHLLIVLKPDLTEIDHHKSRLVLRHPAWGSKTSRVFRRHEAGKPFNAAFAKVGLEPVEDSLHGAVYGIFSFQGKIYYDLWWLNDPQAARSTPPSRNDWRLRVFSAHLERATEICRVRFESPS